MSRTARKPAKKEFVCFSITGEFVTNMARSWLYEENRPYTTVLKFLLSCMTGTDLEEKELIKLANDVLTGKKQFIGNTRDDSYCMVDDDTDVLTRYSLYFENLPEPVPEPVEERETNTSLEKIRAYDKILKKEITKDDYGWLSPDGKFYPVGWGSHDSWARDYITKHFKGVDVFRPCFYCGDFLEKKGWLLLHNTYMGAVELSADELRDASKKQKEFLYDYFTEREMDREAVAVWRQ